MTPEKQKQDALSALESLVYGHNAANMGYEEIRVRYEIIRAALSTLPKASAQAESEA